MDKGNIPLSIYVSSLKKVLSISKPHINGDCCMVTINISEHSHLYELSAVSISSVILKKCCPIMANRTASLKSLGLNMSVFSKNFE